MSNEKYRNRLKNLFDQLQDQSETPQVPPGTARPQDDGKPVEGGPHPVSQDPVDLGTRDALQTPRADPTQPDSVIPAPSWPRPDGSSRAFGFRAGPQQISLATDILTPEGRESLISAMPVSRPANENRPAVLAVPIAPGHSPGAAPDSPSSSILLEILSSEENREWSEDELLLVNQVADQLVLALENARLFEQTTLALADTASLYEASGALSEAQTYDDIIAHLRHFTLLGQMDLSLSLNLFDRVWQTGEPPEWVTVVARWGRLPEIAAGQRLPLSALPVAHLLQSSTPLLIPDLASDPRLDEQARNLYIHHFQAASAIFVPLLVGGKWIGYIHALHSQITDFEPDDLKRLLALAGQAAVALQNLVQLRGSQARAQREYLIREIGGQVSRSLDIEAIMKTTARALGQAMGATHVAVRLTPADDSSPSPDQPGTEPRIADETA